MRDRNRQHRGAFFRGEFVRDCGGDGWRRHGARSAEPVTSLDRTRPYDGGYRRNTE